MCVVIDTNCLSRVFCADNADHLEFLPIKNWIECEEGRIVYGGIIVTGKQIGRAHV